MKITQGANFRPSVKSRRTRAAPTPANFSWKLEPETERNGTPASRAAARASNVLPVPGGPESRIPRGTRPPRRAKRDGSRKKSIVSANSAFASSTPATSSKVTSCFPLASEYRNFPPPPLMLACTRHPINPNNARVSSGLSQVIAVVPRLGCT